MNIHAYIRKQIREILFEDYRFQYDQETGGIKPPTDVIGTAKRALEIASKNNLSSHGGNEGSGLQKAKSLSTGEEVNHAQLKRMKAFFDNNLEKIKQERQSGRDLYSSELLQKWDLWGGDAGMQWVNREIHHTQLTNKTSKKLRPKGTKTLMDPHNTRTHSANHFFTESSSVSPDGLEDFYPESNPFESLVKKWIRGHYVWKNYDDTFTYRFPIEAEKELRGLGINEFKLVDVTNPRNIDFGKKFLDVIANPADWDYIMENIDKKIYDGDVALERLFYNILGDKFLDHRKEILDKIYTTLGARTINWAFEELCNDFPQLINYKEEFYNAASKEGYFVMTKDEWGNKFEKL